jgi:plasmid stabilization system protein ParE
LKVIYSPQAIDDLQTYIRYVAARNPNAAAQVAQRILAVVDQLATGTFDGPEHQLRSGELVRSWPAYPLRIYYRRTGDAVSIVRIYHQARRPIVK